MRPPNMLNKAGPFTFHIHSCMTMQNMQIQGMISRDLTYNKEINGDSLGVKNNRNVKIHNWLGRRVKDMKRYRVEFKAFKTGQWYTKTVIVGDADGVSLFAGNCKNSEKTKVERVPLLRSSSYTNHTQNIFLPPWRWQRADLFRDIIAVQIRD